MDSTRWGTYTTADSWRTAKSASADMLAGIVSSLDRMIAESGDLDYQDTHFVFSAATWEKVKPQLRADTAARMDSLDGIPVYVEPTEEAAVDRWRKLFEEGRRPRLFALSTLEELQCPKKAA